MTPTPAMKSISVLSVFIWFSFLYRVVHSDSDNLRDTTYGPTREQERQLYDVLTSLPPEKQRQLFDGLQNQDEDQLPRSRSDRRRQTFPDDFMPVTQESVNDIRKTIRNGGVPNVRNKRTLKFLVSSLAEILGLRWTLLKYSLIPGFVNNVIGPAPAPSTPAAAAPPGRPSPSPKAPPPPPSKAPPPPPPPKAPPSPPAKPSPAPPARMPPPTIPPNQIDPNTIRYPFRPAPTIPFLNFAPLPAGVTVPYPPLFQWPTPAPPPGGAMPSQPPCAAPPGAGPPPPKPPSRLPLPKPRPPVPPPRRPAKPVLPASPGKPLKLEYDEPVRIEIFNNVKSYLPVSGNVYSGNPTLTTLEEIDETEKYLTPTQAIAAIDQHYNTESSQELNKDYDYGYFTKPPHLVLEEEVHTTPQKVFDYSSRENYHEDDEDDSEELSNDDSDDRREKYEETTPSSDDYRSFSSHNAFEDYPEQVEENRDSINIKSTAKSKIKRKKYERDNKEKMKKRKVSSVFNHTPKSDWKVQSFPPTTQSAPVTKSKIFRNNEKMRELMTTTEFPTNHAKNWRRVRQRTDIRPKYNISESLNPPYSNQKKYSAITRYPNTLSRVNDKPSREFRIVVPNNPARHRRDLFFNDAFKNFNFSSFENFKFDPIPKSTQSQFLQVENKLVPNAEYRKKLEKDVEKYVEKYVEEQINNGEIDVRKPKTTVIELKPKEGPPIKTITTTLSKVIEGKPFLESIIEYSKNINPVSNVGELSGVADESEESNTKNESEEKTNKEPFSWSFSS